MVISGDFGFYEPGPTLTDILEKGEGLKDGTKIHSGTRERVVAFIDATGMKETFESGLFSGSYAMEAILKSGSYRGFVHEMYGQKEVMEYFSDPSEIDIMQGKSIAYEYKARLNQN